MVRMVSKTRFNTNEFDNDFDELISQTPVQNLTRQKIGKSGNLLYFSVIMVILR